MSSEPTIKTPYWQLLKDPRWQKKRLEILNRDRFTCRGCRNDENTLHVHHRWYVAGRKPWEYPDVAYLTLCENCHEDKSSGAPIDTDWEHCLAAFEELNLARFCNLISSCCHCLEWSPKLLAARVMDAMEIQPWTRQWWRGWRKRFIVGRRRVMQQGEPSPLEKQQQGQEVATS